MLLVCYFIVFLFVSCLFFTTINKTHIFKRRRRDNLFNKQQNLKDKKNKYVN